MRGTSQHRWFAGYLSLLLVGCTDDAAGPEPVADAAGPEPVADAATNTDTWEVDSDAQPPDACTPATCASLGKACGTWPDGCGAMLDCPACAQTETCSADGRCVCVPESCLELQRECGKVQTRCGTTQDCGPCTQGTICDEEAGTCGSQATVLVPMPDGVRLWTKVYLPDGAAGRTLATLLDRTPYRAAGDMQRFYDDQAEFYVARGYAFVLQDVRGTHGSEGTFYPMKDEVADGSSTVEWIRQQPWSSGRVGTVGASYEGFTALAAAVGTNVDLVLADDPVAGVNYWNRKGVPSMGTLAYYWGDVDDATAEARITQATNALDLVALDAEVASQTVPVWQDMLRHPTPIDPFWTALTLEPSLDQVCSPVFLANSTGVGWTDPIRVAQGLWTDGCAERRSDVRLVVGNFAHGETIASVVYDLTTQVSELYLRYLDKYLGGEDIDLSSVPQIQYYAATDDVGRTSPSWPPPTSDTEPFYLHPSPGAGTLDSTPPTNEAPSTFVTDPAEADPCDPRNSTNETLVFVSDPLAQHLFVAGMPTLTVFATTTALDADFFVALFDFDPTAQAASLVSWSMARARYRSDLSSPSPVVPDVPFQMGIEFFPVSWDFLPDHSIALSVVGATCSFVENPHTAEPLDAQTERLLATHAILHDTFHASRLVLPVVERGSAGEPAGGTSARAYKDRLDRTLGSVTHGADRRFRDTVRAVQRRADALRAQSM